MAIMIDILRRSQHEAHQEERVAQTVREAHLDLAAED